MTAGVAISFVTGAAFSVATQVLADHKKVNGVNYLSLLSMPSKK